MIRSVTSSASVLLLAHLARIDRAWATLRREDPEAAVALIAFVQALGRGRS
jgi:hypothetical protein